MPETSLVIFCVTLHQPFQRHVGDATNDEAVKITEIDEFIPGTDIGIAWSTTYGTFRTVAGAPPIMFGNQSGRPGCPPSLPQPEGCIVKGPANFGQLR
jgi:hypothetical protein